MSFAAPKWLWLLALLPLLHFWTLWDQKKRVEKLRNFVSETLWPSVIPELHPRATLRKAAVRMMAGMFLILALAHPQWGTREETSSVNGLDVMVVLDVSTSMETEDIAPSRIRKGKHLLRALIERLRGDRVGLVGFAGSAYTASPLTTDMDYLLETLDMLGTRSVSTQGTDIGLGLEAARTALDRGAEEGEKGSDQKKASQAVVLLSDGEDHEEAAIETAGKLKAAGVRVYVLGVGTQKGGPVPVRDETGQLRGYKKSRSGETVVSTFRPDELMKLADAGGGRYWNVTPGEGELEEILQDIGALNRGEFAERKYVVFEDRYQIPLAIAVVLLLLELSMSARRARPAATTMVALAFLLLQTGCVDGGGYFDNENAIQSLKEGKLDEARRLLGQAQAKNPESPALSYNMGDLQAMSKDAAAADKSFEDAARGAEGKGDWSVAGKSRFNQGVVRGGAGNLRGAAESYLNAIDAARKLGGKEGAKLEEDARKNLQLLLEQQKQQQKQDKQDKKDQQEQQDKQQSGQDSQEKKDQQDKQDQQKQDQKKDQQQQNKQYEDPKKSRERFKSQKFSAEDAERVMSELKNKERELQSRMRHQNGRPQSTDKDW